MLIFFPFCPAEKISGASDWQPQLPAVACGPGNNADSAQQHRETNQSLSRTRPRDTRYLPLSPQWLRPHQLVTKQDAILGKGKIHVAGVFYFCFNTKSGFLSVFVFGFIRTATMEAGRVFIYKLTGLSWASSSYLVDKTVLSATATEGCWQGSKQSAGGCGGLWCVWFFYKPSWFGKNILVPVTYYLGVLLVLLLKLRLKSSDGASVRFSGKWKSFSTTNISFHSWTGEIKRV